jgi:hypothetical protein
MRAARAWFLLPLFLIGGSAGWDRPAPDSKTPGKPGVKPAAPVKKADEQPEGKPGLFEAVLEDRSVVRLSLLQEHLQVTTPYGALKVPVGDIQHIAFAPRPVPDTPKRVAAAVEKLKSDAFAQREAGKKELLALGVASFSAVVAAARSTDLEVKQRALAVLAALEKKFPAEELRRKPHDLLETPTFTIAGDIQGGTLKVKTAYFGEKELKLADLRSLRSLGQRRDVTLALDASRYAAPPGTAWLDTKVPIRAGGSLAITASGEIDMYPQDGYNGQYMATPTGPKWAGGYPMNMRQSAAPGVIVGRIGASGKEFTVGAKYTGTPSEVGTLYLRIIPSPWNNASTGEYKMTIRSE